MGRSQKPDLVFPTLLALKPKVSFHQLSFFVSSPVFVYLLFCLSTHPCKPSIPVCRYDLVPHWLCPISTDTADEDASLPECPQTWLPEAVAVPGFMHIFHNLEASIDDSMVLFPKMWRLLKNTEKLLGDADYRKRCLVNLGLEATIYAAHFEGSPPKLYEQRWGYLYNYVQHARGPLLVLRQFWDFGKFKGKTSQSSFRFEADTLQEALESNLFFGYLDMLLLLHKAVQHLRAWTEGCECHGRVAHLGGDGQDMYQKCPLRSLRAAEVACGDLSQLMKTTFSLVEGQLLRCCRVPTSPDEWGQIVHDLKQGLAGVSAILALKLQCWQELPWIACGLAHYNEQKAMYCCQAALQQWEKASPTQRQQCPSEVACLFSDAGFLHVLQQFASGELPRAELPDAVIFRIARLYFIPICERRVEGKHSVIKKRTGYHRAGPVAVSLALRHQEVIEEALERDPRRSFVNLATCFSSARHVRAWAKRMGLLHLPTLRNLENDKQKRSLTSAWISALIPIVYRCESSLQFQDMSAAQHFHERAAERDKVAVRKAQQPLWPPRLLQ